MGITVIIQQPGLLTTIQDQGWHDYLSSALSRGVAQDAAALEIANQLVGNSPTAAGLEITGLGPTLFFNQPVCISCAGAPVQATVRASNGQSCSLPLGRPVVISAGSTVQFSNFLRGFRAWVAFAGGIDSPVVLGSCSSHLAAEIGPPRLVANTTITLGLTAQSQTEKLCGLLRKKYPNYRENKEPDTACISLPWSISNHILTQWPVLTIPVVPGRHFECLSKVEREKLLTQEWRVDARSNRQGLALEGVPIQGSKMSPILSEPVRFGTVQLPPGGKPFVLMAEHQTTGGYPRVLEVVSAGRPLLAQAGPESRLKFVMMDAVGIQQLVAKRRRDLSLTRYAISNLLGPILPSA